MYNASRVNLCDNSAGGGGLKPPSPPPPQVCPRIEHRWGAVGGPYLMMRWMRPMKRAKAPRQSTRTMPCQSLTDWSMTPAPVVLAGRGTGGQMAGLLTGLTAARVSPSHRPASRPPSTAPRLNMLATLRVSCNKNHLNKPSDNFNIQ